MRKKRKIKIIFGFNKQNGSRITWLEVTWDKPRTSIPYPIPLFFPLSSFLSFARSFTSLSHLSYLLIYPLSYSFIQFLFYSLTPSLFYFLISFFLFTPLSIILLLYPIFIIFSYSLSPFLSPDLQAPPPPFIRRGSANRCLPQECHDLPWTGEDGEKLSDWWPVVL